MSADLAIGSPPITRSEPATDWRALLEAHWRSRLERITELSLAYHDAEEAAARAGHGPAAHAEQARPLLREAVAERRALAEIEAALARLERGTFGRCERCREPVPVARLTRTPQARFCAGCDR
jgi:DnaK suppressor protein